jgi:hypothetical protein
MRLVLLSKFVFYDVQAVIFDFVDYSLNQYLPVWRSHFSLRQCLSADWISLKVMVKRYFLDRQLLVLSVLRRRVVKVWARWGSHMLF